MASEQCSGQNAVVAPYTADPTGARDSTHAFIDAIKARRWITTAAVGVLAAGTLASCGGNESSPSQFYPPAGAAPPTATTKPPPGLRRGRNSGGLGGVLAIHLNCYSSDTIAGLAEES
jgi:hypothetical protein